MHEYCTYHSTTYATISPKQPALSTRGKSALVADAGSCIGARVSYSLAQSSLTHLAILSRDRETLTRIRNTIARTFPDTDVFVIPIDLCNAEVTKCAIQAFATRLPRGKIDILVACAGASGLLGPLATEDPDAWQAALGDNFWANYNLIHAFLPLASPGAHVAYMSSAVIHGPAFPRSRVLRCWQGCYY